MMHGVFASLLLGLFLQFGLFSRVDYFAPSLRLSGIGVEREHVSAEVLARRTELMIASQTFSILRDPRALEGAQRINNPKLQKIFVDASKKSGLPASFLSAVAYLESFGNPLAESPAGPKGIMQITASTARSMGLRMIYATKYRQVVETREVKTKRGKKVKKTVRRKVPYQVLVRDERMVPQRAIPAAAQYLARMESKYGSRDWAIFAYHCGEGCVGEILSLLKHADGFPDKHDISVASAFFGSSPVHNRELYDALQHHMERDYSPTYWFRITRAQQLLAMHREDPQEFSKLFFEYRNRVNPEQRAPHRLAVWLKPEDLNYRSCEDLKREQGKKLVRAFDNSKYYNFALRTSGAGSIGEADPANREFYQQASPSTIGAIAYVAFETRRLHDAMKVKGEKWVPLEITALVEPLDYEERSARSTPSGRAEAPSHCSGQVFDLNFSQLPPGEREALNFVLTDMGWDGYIGFVRESSNGSTYHVGPAPTARDFFTRVYDEAVEKKDS